MTSSHRSGRLARPYLFGILMAAAGTLAAWLLARLLLNLLTLD